MGVQKNLYCFAAGVGLARLVNLHISKRKRYDTLIQLTTTPCKRF